MRDNEALTVIPPWLSNPKLVAPCPCGAPLDQMDDWLVAGGESGLRTWFHMECFQMMMSQEGDD